VPGTSCPECGSDWVVAVDDHRPGLTIDATGELVMVLAPEPGASDASHVCALCGHRFAVAPERPAKS
jgi:hypothetical protein